MVFIRSGSRWFKVIMLFIFFKVPLSILFGKWSLLPSPWKFESDIEGSKSPRRTCRFGAAMLAINIQQTQYRTEDIWGNITLY